MGLIITYDKLVQTLTESEGFNYVLQLAKTFKFPATSFLSGSIGYTLLKTQGALLAIISDSVASISKQIYTSTSTGDWLTLLAENHWDEERGIATQTVIEPRIWTVGAVANSYAEETVKINIGGIEFYNSESFSIPADGYTDVEFTSTEYGEDTRVATNLKPIFTQNAIGNAVFYQISNEDGYFSIISNGQNEESDIDLRERCTTKWATLSSLGPEAAYKNWIITAKNTENQPVDITRIKIDRSDAQTIGVIVIYCASDTGAASAEDIAFANTVVQANRSINAIVYVDPAEERTFNYTMTVTCNGSAETNDTLLKASILAAIKDYLGTVDIGGTVLIQGQNGWIIWAEIVDKIMDITGVVNVTINSLTVDTVVQASDDVQINPYDVAVVDDTTQTDSIIISRV